MSMTDRLLLNYLITYHLKCRTTGNGKWLAQTKRENRGQFQRLFICGSGKGRCGCFVF